MKSTTYKFELKSALLDQQPYYVRDYFESYTTGVENIVHTNPEHFAVTSRENAERPESIMYQMFDQADEADMFIAINNQNYLWATPFNLDAFQDAIDFRMNYLELLMRDRITKEPELDVNDDIVRDENGVILYNYNQAGTLCRDRVSEDIHNEDDKARTIIIPNKDSVQYVSKMIKDYFTTRKVR